MMTIKQPGADPEVVDDDKFAGGAAPGSRGRAAGRKFVDEYLKAEHFC